MTESFIKMREILKNANIPQDVDISNFPELCYQRLFNALKSTSGTGDIASLIRHILRFEDEKQGGNSQTLLQIPKKPNFPQREIWEDCGMNIVRENEDNYLITANYWQPKWLDNTDKYPPDRPLFAESPRRNYQPVNGDPFLKKLQLNQYRSIGQREAIRAILTAPEKSTLIINLPTGSGKSLCAHLPALLTDQNHGVSIVVVPTVALAIDQERALKPFIDHPTAYYSDDSEQGQIRRQEIRKRIFQGTQKIIFTSPESLIYSLSSSIYAAAKQGKLKYFVIDEAHIIEQWGNEFRPAFQQLPGLIRDLLKLTSFTTLLLTATLTRSCLDTLESLFGNNLQNNLQVISAVQLRPEPAFWFKYCKSQAERKERLIEAVYHLPKPLIIYTTKIADVKYWKQELYNAGFKRLGIMTGESSKEKRHEILENWQQKNIDIVIATSAFGLGVDQSDVRAVIHLCIPENINRFYQEVGRGGRDGNACLSLTLYTDEDFDIAKKLNDDSPITIERGYQRWYNMFTHKEILSNGKFRVNINLPPSWEEKDIDMTSDENRAWNLRTLTLLQRSQIIDIESESNFNQINNTCLISIKNEEHLDQYIWETQIEPLRIQRQKWSYQIYQLMEEALNPKRCISEIFTQAYSIPARHGAYPRKAVKVAPACGGCPVCRQNNRQPFQQIMPSPSPVWKKPKFQLGTKLQNLLLDEKLLLIFYKSLSQNTHKNLNSVLKCFIEQGIINIVISPEFTEISLYWQEITSIVFLWEKYQPWQMPQVPTLIFHSPGEKPDIYLTQNSKFTAPRIILLPLDTPDPSRMDRNLIDIFPGRQLKFDVFCQEINI
ncbi:MAG: hypothetical protein RLZZ507_2008 [Cyanobacteriota bacterium]|jgi:RecQ family ATP-dependent DNA helicase